MKAADSRIALSAGMVSYSISTVTTSEERLCVSCSERDTWTVIIENPELLVLEETH